MLLTPAILVEGQGGLYNAHNIRWHTAPGLDDMGGSPQGIAVQDVGRNLSTLQEALRQGQVLV